MSTAPPSPPQWPAIIALVVALGGIPAATAWAFADTITQNPWRASAVAVVYLLGVFVVSALTKIWQRLETPWLDQVARWVDETVRRRFSGYHRRYQHFMEQQHRFFDVKGLTTQGPYSLMLHDVFVDLSLAPQPAHQVSTDPIRAVPEALRAGQHSIWAYLQAKQMHGQDLAVLGAPGSGKTTLLRHIALVMATGKRPAGISSPRHVPILLFLRDHAAAIVANPQLTLAAAIHDHLARNEGPLPPPAWFERQLAAGNCVVMLDGLDEVADLAQRRQIVQWVDRQLSTHPTNRFIVTSRPFGFQTTPLERVTILEVRPFTRAQVGRFVNNWYLANELMSTQRDDAGVRRDARHGARDLLDRLRDTQNLADLAINPLLLTMIANVHRYSSSLPERRVELYREICTVFLGKRQQARGIVQELTPAQKQLVLQTLAFAMMIRQVREIGLSDATRIIREPLERISLGLSGEAFLKQIEESSGLLLEREQHRYGFAHLTFQEYLAATHILEQQREQVLISNVGESWWHETIRLYAAQTDASRIMNACMTNAAPSIAALTVAIDCSEEAREIAPDVRARFDTLLTVGVEDADPVRRQLVAEALLARRLRRMVRLDDQRAIDTSLLSNAEYQLFLDEYAAQGIHYHPDHWVDTRFRFRQGRASALGLRPSDAQAFCEWLTERANGTASYRLPHTSELPRAADGTIQLAARSNGLVCWLAGASSARIYLSSLRPEIALTLIEQRVEQDYNDMEVQVFESFASRARQLGYMLARAHDLALALKFDLAFDLARARHLAQNLARDSGSVRDLAQNLAHISVRDIARTSARDLGQNLAHELAKDSEIALTRASANDRFLTLANDLKVASTLAHSLSTGIDSHLASTSDRAQRAVIAYYQSNTNNRSNILNLDRWFTEDLDLNPERDIKQISANAGEPLTNLSRFYLMKQVTDLSFDQALARVRNHSDVDSSGQRIDLATVRWAIRFTALLVLSEFELNRANPSLVQRMLRRDGDAQAKLQKLIDTYADLYVDFTILEERIAGALPPSEGLLLLRETTPPSAEPERPRRP